jgi:hypothetical protein
MLALLAALCFFFALFKRAFGPVDLLVAGLLCLALHHLAGGGITWPPWPRHHRDG